MARLRRFTFRPASAVLRPASAVLRRLHAEGWSIGLIRLCMPDEGIQLNPLWLCLHFVSHE